MQTKPHPKTILILKQNKEMFETSVRFNNFTDGDTHSLIEHTEHIANSNILIRHYLYPNQNEQIVRLLLLINTLNDLGARSIEVFTPYMPYARQDRAHSPGESVSSAILCRLLKNSGCRTLHTIDCHFMKGEPWATRESLKIHNILVKDLLSECLRSSTKNSYSIIGPDAGSAYLTDGVTMKKRRADYYDKSENGSIRRSVATIEGTHLRLKHRTLVISDDMVSTGSTMIRALESLKARGVKELYVMTTHGLFLEDSFDKLQALTAGIIYSDTISRNGAVAVVDTVFNKLVNDFYLK